jgi:hypothetical protein
MLGRAAYRERWKKAWYEKNGNALDQSLSLRRTTSAEGWTRPPSGRRPKTSPGRCKEACGTLQEGVRRSLQLYHLRARSDGMRVCYRKAPWRLGHLALNSTGCG